MKKATFTAPGEPLKVIDDVIPDVASEGALIKTSYCGVCHTDTNLKHSKFDLGEGEIFSPSANFGDKFIGTTFGHEVSGTIIALGDKVDSVSVNLKIGDNVIVYVCYGCQSCGQCKAGMSNLCPNLFEHTIGVGPENGGGFATHVMVSNCRNLIKVPRSIPMHMACMLPCSGVVAYSSLLRTKTEIERALLGRGEANLLMIGVGGLGSWCVQLAKKLMYPDKNVRIFVADIKEGQVKFALDGGADEGFVWKEDDTIFDIVKQTTKNGDIKMDAVIDFVGIPKTAGSAVKCLTNGGILLVIGVHGGSMPLQLPVVVMSSLTIKGWANATYEELVELVHLLPEVDIKLPPLTFCPLEDINKALNELESGMLTGRAILKLTDN